MRKELKSIVNLIVLKKKETRFPAKLFHENYISSQVHRHPSISSRKSREKNRNGIVEKNSKFLSKNFNNNNYYSITFLKFQSIFPNERKSKKLILK